MNLECRNCKETGKDGIIAEQDQLYLYRVSENTFYIGLKVLLNLTINSLYINRKEKHKEVQCRKCNEHLGFLYKDNKSIVTLFNNHTIIFNGNKYSKKVDWKIENKRLMKEFEIVDLLQSQNDIEECTAFSDMPPIIYINSNEEITDKIVSEYDHRDLTETVPKYFQLEAFVESINSNLIICAPTGTGKTLISVMNIAKLLELNPRYMALFIVDKIPLVNQHSDYIAKETTLGVIRLHGEGYSDLSLKNIRERKCDVVVGTAGAIEGQLKCKGIEIQWFCSIIFDECHHSTKGHKYVSILDIISTYKRQNTSYHPRLLGLSATPIDSKNIDTINDSFKDLNEKFDEPLFYYNREIIKNTINPDIRYVNNSVQQNELCKRIIDYLSEKSPIDFNVSYTTLSARLGEIRNKIQNGILEIDDRKYSYSDTEKELIIRLIDIYESVYWMGCRSVEETVNEICDEKLRDELLTIIREEEGLPERLKELRDLLKDFTQDSSIIVFCERKSLAHFLEEWINREIKENLSNRITGHGGILGMEWKDQQQVELNKFRKGETKVIVSTSVVEEGLDIQKCDLVVRYSGVNNYTSFVQSAGRARKENSKFVLLVFEEDKQVVNKIIEQGPILENFFENQTKNCPTSKTKEIVERLRNIRTAPTKDTYHNDKLLHQFNIEDSLVLEFFIPDLIFDENNVEKIGKFCSQYDDFTVENICLLNCSISTMSNIFKLDSTFVIVNLKTKGSPNYVPNLFKQIIKNYIPKIEIDNTEYDIFLKCYSDYAVDEKLIVMPLYSSGLSIGQFVNTETFHPFSKIESRLSFTIYESDVIQILFSDVYEFQLDVHSILFLLVSFDRKLKSFTVYFVLKMSPNLYNSSDPKKKVHEIFGCCDDEVKDLLASLNNYNVLSLEFQFSDWIFLSSYFTVSRNNYIPVLITEIRIDENEPEFPAIFKDQINKDVFDVLWNINVLCTSYNILVTCDLKIRLLNLLLKYIDSGDQYSIRNMKQMLNYHFPYYWIDQQDSFSTIREYFRVEPENYFYSKKANWTPNRIIYYPEILTQHSRMTRMIRNDYFLISLSFMQEDFMGLSEGPESESIHKFLIDGFSFYNIPFSFFISSASSLREHKAWFIQGNKEVVESYRSNIIPNKNEFISIAKYISRLGLYGTNDYYLGELSIESTMEIPDLKAENGDTLTDGCGYISTKFGKEIEDLMRLQETTAYQFRYNGMKGMLVKYDKEEMNDEIKLLYRPSMKKFSNQNFELCIVKTSKQAPVKLNREIITILWGMSKKVGWGDLKKSVMNLQEKCIREYFKGFLNRNDTLTLYSEYFLPYNINEISRRINFTTDPYWFRIYQRMYYFKLKDLRSKTHIPVTDGCLLFGISDPTQNTLEEGEVFVQISSKENKRIILNRDILIYRNPCLYPGDIRVVKAVYKKELEGFINVIIFPTKNCKTSLASSCSGGDLDGDQYSVIWDKGLIPPKSSIDEPLDYSSLVAKNLDPQEITEDGIADFFVKNVMNSSLGRIANMHLALCDFLEEGIFDERCKKLAEAQSIAVDFPKTGQVPKIPSDVPELIAKYGSPDFMEKKDSYQSKELLGILYHELDNRLRNVENVLKRKDHSSKINKDKKIYAEISEILNKYQNELSILMNSFCITDEVDIIIGDTIWNKNIFRDRLKASESLRISYRSLKERFLNIFEEKTRDMDDSKEYTKVWFEIGYEKNVMSFSWIIEDYLVNLDLKSKDMHKLIGEEVIDIHRTYASGDEYNINEKYKELIQKFDELDEFDLTKIPLLQNEENVKFSDLFTLNPTGSFSLCLLQGEEVVDLHLGFNEKFLSILKKTNDNIEINEHSTSIILNELVMIVFSSYFDEVKIADNNKVIECKFKSQFDTINFNVTTDNMEVEITNYLLDIFINYNEIYVTFWVIMKWASQCLLISNSPNSSQMSIFDFYFLLINIYKIKGELGDVAFQQNGKLSTLNVLQFTSKIKEFISEDVSSARIGKMICIFYCLENKIDPNVGFTYKHLKGEKSLTKDFILAYNKNIYNAIESLYTSHDINFIILPTNKIGSSEYTEKLNERLSKVLYPSKHFHQAYLSYKSGAKVTLGMNETDSFLSVKGEGSQREIAALKNEIANLKLRQNFKLIGKVKSLHNYIIDDGFQILTQYPKNEKISFKFCDVEPSMRDYHKGRHQIVPRNPKILKEWDKKMLNSFFNQMFVQINKLSGMLNKSSFLSNLNVTAIFGYFFVINMHDLPSHMRDQLTADDVQKLIENDLKSRTKILKNKDKYRTRNGEYTEESEMVEEVNDKNRGGQLELIDLPSCTSSDLLEKLKRKMELMNKIKRGLSHRFVSHKSKEFLLRKNSTNYRRILEELDYGVVNDEIEIQKINKRKFTFSMNHPKYDFLRMELNDRLECPVFKIRRNRLLLTTLMFNDMGNGEDVRLSVDYRTDLDQKELMDFYFKDGFVSPVEQDKESEDVTLSSKVPLAFRKMFVELFHSKEVYLYQKNNTLAAIKSGVEIYYTEGKEVDRRNFCHLQLFFSEDFILRSLDSELHADYIKSNCESILKEVVAINELIKRNGIK